LIAGDSRALSFSKEVVGLFGLYSRSLLTMLDRGEARALSFSEERQNLWLYLPISNHHTRSFVYEPACVCVCTHVYVRICTCVHVCASDRGYDCKRAYVYLCVLVCTYVYEYIYLRTRVYVLAYKAYKRELCVNTMTAIILFL